MRVGTILVVVGIGLAVVGLAVRLGLFSWFGNLPGDVRIEGESSTVFVPITSMLLVSVVGSLVLNVLLRWFRG